MNKEDRRRFSPADDSHKNHTPKVYKKLKEKLRIDQLPAYPKSRVLFLCFVYIN